MHLVNNKLLTCLQVKVKMLNHVSDEEEALTFLQIKVKILNNASGKNLFANKSKNIKSQNF